MEIKHKNKLTTGNSRDKLAYGIGNEKHTVIKKFQTDIKKAKLNIQKQKKFQEIRYSDVRIKAVPVESERIEKDEYLVTMPYIEGVVGEDYAKFGTTRHSRKLRVGLDAIVMSEMTSSEYKTIQSKIFKEKIEEILAQNIESEHKVWIESIYREIKDSYKMPIGVCHGDLTLNNIIYSDGEFNLIDFLSGYIESPLQDVAKIMQDFKYGWSFRYMNEPEKIKASIFTNSAIPESLKFWGQVFKAELSLVNKISIARIAPYVSDEKTNRWLKETSRRIFNE